MMENLSQEAGGTRGPALIFLDNLGIDPGFTSPVQRRTIQGRDVVFRDTTLDRTIEVNVYVIEEDPPRGEDSAIDEEGEIEDVFTRTCNSALSLQGGLLEEFAAAIGRQQTGAAPAQDGQPVKILCRYSSTLPPRSEKMLAESILRRAAEMPIRFVVSFFDQEERPTHQIGYLDYLSAEDPQLPLAAPSLQALDRRGVPGSPSLEIELKNDGVTSGVIRNARRPQAALREKADENSVKGAELQNNFVRFRNLSSRDMIITFPVQISANNRWLKDIWPDPENATARFKGKYSSLLKDCSPASPSDEKCNFSFLIRKSQEGDLELLPFSLSPDRPVQIRVAFADPRPAQEKPAHPLGFINIANTRPSIPDRFDLKMSGSIERLDDAFFSLPDATGVALIQESAPYEGDRRNFYSAVGRIDFTHQLGDRVRSRARLVLKEGTLGAKADDKSNNLTVPEYDFQISGYTGLSLRFGKHTFAQPNSTMALRERGEGYSLIYDRVSLTHMLRRESIDGVANSQDDDSQAYVLQALRLPLPGNVFQTYSLYAAYGEEEGRLLGAPSMEVRSAWNYYTFGGEVNFNAPARIFGTASIFWSSRDQRSGIQVDGRGRSWVMDATWLIKQGKAHSLTAIVGEGTGDNPNTLRNEAYIGETGTFSKDAIFLSRIAPALRLSDGKNPIGGGLGNKQYYSLQYGHADFSPLALFAEKILKVNKSDINFKSTTLKYHDYFLQRSLFGSSHAGRELDLELLVETPKGVKVSLTGAYFRPGGALNDDLRTLVGADVWSVSAKVSIETQ
jgi:hypothetical protein